MNDRVLLSERSPQVRKAVQVYANEVWANERRELTEVEKCIIRCKESGCSWDEINESLSVAIPKAVKQFVAEIMEEIQ